MGGSGPIQAGRRGVPGSKPCARILALALALLGGEGAPLSRKDPGLGSLVLWTTAALKWLLFALGGVEGVAVVHLPPPRK